MGGPDDKAHSILDRFEVRCRAMNARYDLPVSTVPTLDVGETVSARLLKFKRVLEKELAEVEDIIQKAVIYDHRDLTTVTESEVREMQLDILTDIADLMVDLQVYEVSEMVKFGIPLATVQDIVMDSNESKLGADGKPLKDADGKFLKGPNYWKPEPLIRAYLARLQEQAGK